VASSYLDNFIGAVIIRSKRAQRPSSRHAATDEITSVKFVFQVRLWVVGVT
jgi:hypothetical protein